MKHLEPLNIARLTNLQFGQHTKSVYDDITNRGGSTSPITDAILNGYLTELNLKNEAYDKAMVQIAKSDETAQIVKADGARDKALSSLERYLAVYEFTTDAAMALSYESLHTLFSHYKRMQRWDFEQESNGIDNLIVDLRSDRYNGHVDLLGMLEFVLALETANNNFKAIFKTRTLEQASKEVFDVKQLRSDLKTTYEKTVNYVLAMATAMDTPEFNDTLAIINTVRKYYSDMVSRKKAEKKPVTPAEN